MEWPTKRQFEMNGIDLVVDTNILINLAEGKPGADHYLTDNKLFISVITEIELLSWHKISTPHRIFFNELLNDCKIVELMPDIKKITIELKQQHKVKLPDAVIAATAIYLDVPLLTYDPGFEKIKSLNLLLLN